MTPELPPFLQVADLRAAPKAAREVDVAIAPLQQLSDQGQCIRVDFLSRRALTDGTIGRLMREDAGVG
jgi:hypothetical protein